jgi:secondary thiamine-phosphate synthase enzyme
MIYEIKLQTRKREEMIDITTQVEHLLRQDGTQEGLLVVFNTHTTAGVTINENADPDVQRYILQRLGEIFPWDKAGDFHCEGNSAAHLKASTIGASQTVILEKGKMLLGHWQGIYFCEFDGPRSRTCFVKILK